MREMIEHVCYLAASACYFYEAAHASDPTIFSALGWCYAALALLAWEKVGTRS